ncbi:MAG: LysR substrate-binding domain-containing protein [Alphaproteobacteria bacterium]|nr:LysR substrate-binding domain-containing protein [Alphaproteobacteria bacterium]
MIGVTIRHLRYFAALAKTRHFGRAAEACAISQPALSVQIKELEEMLGVPLVERSARQIRLTALGEDFALRAQDILHRIDDLGDLARAARDGLSGPFRIGFIPTVAPYLLPRCLQALSDQYPALELRPREAVTQKLIDDLAEARLDAAVLALPTSHSWLHETAILDEEFLLVRPLKDEGAPVPSAARLREMRLLLLEEGHCFRDQALAFCQLSPSTPRPVMEGSSLATLVQMTAAGLGVTLIPEMAAPVETRSAAVSLARLAPPRPARTIGLVWRKTNPLSDRLARIAAALREAAAPPPARFQDGPKSDRPQE